MFEHFPGPRKCSKILLSVLAKGLKVVLNISPGSLDMFKNTFKRLTKGFEVLKHLQGSPDMYKNTFERLVTGLTFFFNIVRDVRECLKILLSAWSKV